MYRCNVCQTLCGPKKPLQVHRILRPVNRFNAQWGQPGEPMHHTGTEIAQEIPVCEPCKKHLDKGEPITRVARRANGVPVQLDEIDIHAPETEAVI